MSNWQHIGALVAPILSTVEPTKNDGQYIDSERVLCQKKSEPRRCYNTRPALDIGNLTRRSRDAR